MTRLVHQHHNLLQLSSRNLSKKQNTLIQKQPCLRNVSQSSEENACYSHLLSGHFPLRLWPPAHFLPILLHHSFCFCHILLWLPCVILFFPVFPCYFGFPTGSFRAWTVIWDWLDNIPCARVACLYWQRQGPLSISSKIFVNRWP